MFYRDERLAIFIDGPNTHAASEICDFNVDYHLVRELYKSRGKLVRAKYYTTIFENQDYSPVQPLLDWLGYNGFVVVTKPAVEYKDNFGVRRLKGNMNVEIATDALELSDHVDHIVLFSGRYELLPLVSAVQRKGVRLTIVSTLKGSPPMVSSCLRRQSDHFIDLYDLRNSMSRGAL